MVFIYKPVYIQQRQIMVKRQIAKNDNNNLRGHLRCDALFLPLIIIPRSFPTFSGFFFCFSRTEPGSRGDGGRPVNVNFVASVTGGVEL